MADFSAFEGRACPDWYLRPQLGIFIHWGIFAMPAWAPRGESITKLVRTLAEPAAQVARVVAAVRDQRASAG